MRTSESERRGRMGVTQMLKTIEIQSSSPFKAWSVSWFCNQQRWKGEIEKEQVVTWTHLSQQFGQLPWKSDGAIPWQLNQPTLVLHQSRTTSSIGVVAERPTWEQCGRSTEVNIEYGNSREVYIKYGRRGELEPTLGVVFRYGRSTEVYIKYGSRGEVEGTMGGRTGSSHCAQPAGPRAT